MQTFGKRELSLADSFRALVGPETDEERIDLVSAALVIARTHYPDLHSEPCFARLDDLAKRVSTHLSHRTAHSHRTAQSAETIAALNAVLFDEEGFRGNRDDYYDPRNSFLNDVLERRTGIPITLSLVYMEVARRIGFPLFGVGMPGHFLLKYFDVESGDVLIDVFNRGSTLTSSDCQQRLKEIYAGALTLQPEFLQAVSRRQMLTRMLNNLKSIYLTARQFRKALPIIDLILAIYPRSPEDVKQRGALRHSLGNLPGALRDYDDYLKMSPDSSDSDEVRQTALAIRKALAHMN